MTAYDAIQEIVSKFDTSDWIAVIAVIVAVIAIVAGSVTTLGGIYLTHVFAVRREEEKARREREKAKEEFIDKEIAPLLVYVTKLMGLDKLLREDTSEDALDERLESIHSTYIRHFFKLKSHLDGFITKGKIRYLMGDEENMELFNRLMDLNAKFESYHRGMEFVASREPLEVSLPADITYRDYEGVQHMLATLEQRI